METIVLPNNSQSLELLSEALPLNMEYFDATTQESVNDQNTNKPNLGSSNTGHTIRSHKTHDYVYSQTIYAPDCTNDGLDEYVCTICGETTQVVTEKLGHSYSEEWYYSSEGHYHVCTVCSEKDNVIPHEYDNGTITIYPDCENIGNQQYICEICGHIKNEAIKCLGHEFSEWCNRQEATCTIDGFKGHYYCLRCQKNFDASYKEIEDIVIPKTGHSYSDEWYYSIDGHFHVCTICSQRDSTIRHEYDDGTIITDPDCEHNGMKKYLCKICGHSKREIIKSLGHEFSEWHEREEATCLHEGVKGYYECLTCHKFFNEKYEEIEEIVINTLKHHFVYYPGISSTCFMEGHIGYYKCTLCEKLFNEDKEEVSEIIIPKKAHEYSEEWEINSNEHYHRCKICGEIADKESHDFGEWVEDNDKATRECSKCHYQKTKTIEHEEPIEEVPKDNNDMEWLWLLILLPIIIIIFVVYIIYRSKHKQNKRLKDAL